MNHLLDDDEEVRTHAAQREITLSAASILGIFFGLALICALFFGFGYNIGHKSTQAASASGSLDDADNPSSSTNFNAFKPAAGSPIGSSAAIPAPAPASANALPAAPVVNAPPAASSHSSSPTVADETPAVARPIPTPVPPAPTHPTESFPMADAASAGSFVVQVAAVSHQEDAELLVGALKRKGYTVAARSEPQDKLVHIQVGPFGNRKDADTMRQRLLTDGYNAIVK